MGSVRRLIAATCILAATATVPARAQAVAGVVVDQTNLPLPGATVQLLDGTTVVRSLVTTAEGSFRIDDAWPGDTLVVSLEGFESRHVPRTEANRIVLEIARATESTTVTAPALAESSPTAPLLGGSLTSSTIGRLPSSHMKARESLPLLPSVVRGADGLMQLGGARAYHTPLTLDGFDVTDPATGLSSLNLPFEAVKGVDALRDPMAVTYGRLLGGLVSLESRPGGDRRSIGAQGFIPRPRFTTPNFGRLEGIFPRAHIAGSHPTGQMRYIVAAEYDYERIPVPDVVDPQDNDLVERSGVLFARLDAKPIERHEVTVEGFVFPTGTQWFGLSPRRDRSATVDLRATDAFWGITDRFLSSSGGLFTIQVGMFTREADATPNGSGPSRLTPSSWQGSWFSTVSRSATRYTAVAKWERVFAASGRSHDVTVVGEMAARRLSGRVHEQPITVANAGGQTIRAVEFGAASAFQARDWPVGLALRDLWQINQRLQIDAGARVDHSRHGGGTPSARSGLRYALDESNRTVVKAGYGSFVGRMPLTIPAFANYPIRTDRWLDGETGDVVREIVLRPTVGNLRFPRAVALVLGLERELARGLDAQVLFTRRRSTRLSTLRVPNESGDLMLDSTGMGNYQEVQLSLRRAWQDEQQVFVSYVESSADGELNEFATIFQATDAPLLQPGGRARTTNDARHRLLAWGTLNLPRRVVVSPVVEWRSGFPYSAMTSRYTYDGQPNGRAFPTFFSMDLVAYKNVVVKRRAADVGIQLFNVTNHRNYRDVYPVMDAPRAGQFANSVGPILRGYFLLKW